MAIQDVSRIFYLLLLPGIIVHLCTCTMRHDSYNKQHLENEKYCHPLNKKSLQTLQNATAVIVKPYHMFDHWMVDKDRHCIFSFKALRNEGIMAVIQKINFRRNGTECLDYIRFKRSDGHRTNKFCGEFNRIENSLSIHQNTNNFDAYGEYDPIVRSTRAEIETEIFISKERVLEQPLDLIIVYTPFRNCNEVDHEHFESIEYNVCIRKEYICDKIFNCLANVCSDERNNCSYTLISDLQPREDTATKVTVGAVTTMILCFIIFIMCLWICKRSQKLCWSSDCAGPNVCSRPGSLPRESEGSHNPGVPTAPMLEVAVSSPHGDKDLPPSYDSLFPEQSNPARSISFSSVRSRPFFLPARRATMLIINRSESEM